jgi:hypothetical protein
VLTPLASTLLLLPTPALTPMLAQARSLRGRRA